MRELAPFDGRTQSSHDQVCSAEQGLLAEDLWTERMPSYILSTNIVAGLSHIEWTEATWNPVTGCTKISAGCKNCYAERMSRRLKAMGKPQYANEFKLTLQPEMLDAPLGWKRGRVIFVNSMSDLFHEGVGLPYTQQVFDVMNRCPQHTFQILTKRPEIAATFADRLRWSRNIWMGTSVEDVRVLHRVKSLQRIPAHVRFLSVEPLLGPIPRLPLTGLHWVIVGGESGPGCREISPDWVRQIRDRCVDREVPFFFKQWGGVNKKAAGRILDGRTWDEMPAGEREHERHVADHLAG